MALDEFLKGLAVFNEGMTQWASSRAINDANEKMQALNAQQMERGQLLEAKNQVAQELSMRLGQAGATPAMIDQLAGQIAPSLSAQFQAGVNEESQARSQQFQASEAEKDRQLRRELAAGQAGAGQAKVSEQRRKELGTMMTGYQKEFNRLTQKSREAATMAGSVKEIIQSGNPVGDQTVGLFMAKMVQGGSQLSDAEREIFQGSPALLNKAKSIAQKYTTGKMLTEADRKFMTDLADKFQRANQAKINAVQGILTNQAFERVSATGFSASKEEVANWFGTNQPMTQPKQQGAAKPQANQSGMIKMKGPDGKIRLIPAAQREAALKAGGVEVP